MDLIRRTRAVTTLASVGLAATAALYLAAARLVDVMTAPGRREPERHGFTPFETGVRWEDVTVPTEDGSALPGWLFLASEAAPVVLACGGYRGQRSDLLGISSALWRAGFNVLLFDYRGHGGAPVPVTLGYHELADARAAVVFLRRRFPESALGAIGFSMGAAVALMAAAREPDLRAVVADSPFETQREIVRFRVRQAAGWLASRPTGVLGDAVVALADRRLRRRLGFGFADLDPLREAALLSQPLLLVHGEADRDVPVEHSRRIAAAAAQAGVLVETWFLPGAGHCEAYFLDRPRYCERVVAFFRQHLGPGGAR